MFFLFQTLNPKSRTILFRPQMASMSETIESFKKEVEILSLFDHPHVLKLYGAVVSPKP
jgi:hypothetical protein